VNTVLKHFVITLAIFAFIAFKHFAPGFTREAPCLLALAPVFVAAWLSNRAVAYSAVVFLMAVILFDRAESSLLLPVLFGVEASLIVFFVQSCRSIILAKRKKADLLAEALAMEKNIVDNLPHLAWWTASPELIGRTHYNKQWEEYTGLPRPPHGRDYMAAGAIHPDDLKLALPKWKEYASHAPDELWMAELRIRRRDGEYRWHLWRGNPTEDPVSGDKLWIGTCTDIHDEKRAVDMLAAQDQRKDEFLATLAHELRNPLAPVVNALAVLRKRRHEVDPSLANMLEMIGRQTRQLSRIVEDILDMTRISRGKWRIHKESHDLHNDLMHAIEAVRPWIDHKRQHLKIETSPHPLTIDGDCSRLTQVFTNILSNSSKYTETDGCIWIAARLEGNTIVVKVQDTGVGIAPENQAGIFDIFKQEERSRDKSQGGLGIGLSLVKKIVEAHGGSVSCYSKGIGHGTTITVCLPASGADLMMVDKDKGNDYQCDNNDDGRSEQSGVVS